jgi:hypothetical protein
LSPIIYLFCFLGFLIVLWFFLTVCFRYSPDGEVIFFAKLFPSNTNTVLFLCVSSGNFLWHWISLVLLFLLSRGFICFFNGCMFFHLLPSLPALLCQGDLALDILR